MIETITRAEVLRMISAKEKIGLIKAYRDITGKGLKDSKEAICEVIDAEAYDIDGILNLFTPYIDNDVDDLKRRMDQGLHCAIDNYLILGFDDPFDAVQVVIDNLRKQVK